MLFKKAIILTIVLTLELSAGLTQSSTFTHKLGMYTATNSGIVPNSGIRINSTRFEVGGVYATGLAGKSTFQLEAGYSFVSSKNFVNPEIVSPHGGVFSATFLFHFTRTPLYLPVGVGLSFFQVRSWTGLGRSISNEFVANTIQLQTGLAVRLKDRLDISLMPYLVVPIQADLFNSGFRVQLSVFLFEIGNNGCDTCPTFD